MKNRLIALLLLLSLLLGNTCCASAQTTSQKDEKFKNALAELENYLGDAENNVARLAGIEEDLKDLGNYKQIGSSLWCYVKCLVLIAEDEYGPELNSYLAIIKESDAKINDFISKNNLSLGTVEQLTQYAKARKLEYEGNYQDAVQAYHACEGFFDSLARSIHINPSNNEETFDQAMALLRKGNLEEAYMMFKSIEDYGQSGIMMQSIVLQLGYTPTAGAKAEKQTPPSPAPTEEPLPELILSAKAYDGWITLSWNKIENVKKLTLYQTHIKSGNEKTFEIQIDEQKYLDGTVYYGAYYYYTLEAKLKNGKTVHSNKLKIQAVSAAQPEEADESENGGENGSSSGDIN